MGSNSYRPFLKIYNVGVAEWLCGGLQIRIMQVRILSPTPKSMRRKEILRLQTADLSFDPQLVV